MADLSFPLIVAITATFLGAGIVKGVTGMGLPTVAMGVLGALISPRSAATLLLIPSLVTNVWQLLAGPGSSKLVRRFWPMMLTIVIGTMAGSTVLASGNTVMTTAGLGLALAVYAGYALLARPLRIAPRWERRLSLVIGLLTGLVTGTTGVFVFPAVPYLQALDLERDDLVQALGLSFTTSTVALAAGLLWHGAAPAGHWLGSMLAVLPALSGMAVGQAIRTRIDPRLFRRIFFLLLLLLGMDMILRAAV